VEQATLRPVPLRPVGPVDPAEALAHVLAALPDLSEDAARALSLVEIAGRTRDTALEEMEVSPEALAELLYGARKALRRSMFPLSASGWCERAERLLSDRIDGVLTPPGPARLDVHLRNCERCVDHERRLSQAREKLVREFIDAHPHTAGAGPAERPAATLRVVAPVAADPAYDGPTRTVSAFGGVMLERGEADRPMLSFAGPGGEVEIRVEAPRVPE
jgi:Putative zinc-finger